MLLPEQQLFRLPTDINDEQAVLLEPTAVAIHAVLRRPPQQNERVLIIGAGAIGLLTLQVVRALAPQAEVSVRARHSFQIEQATRLGATHIIYPQDSYTDIQRATNAQLYKGAFGNKTLLGGYDVIFDTVGNQNTLHHALRWARAQATVVLVGVNLHLMHIDLTPVWYREVNLIGTMGSSVENWPPATNERRSTFEVALELIKHNRIHPELLITHRFPLDNYQTALLTAAGKAQSHAIKVVFDYSLLPPSVVPNVRASAARKRRPSLPIDESTSTPEIEATPERIPQPAEPAIAVPLSPLFSSSQTVAPLQYEDDEFDVMEDTMPALASIKYNMQTPLPQQQEEHHFEHAEDILTLPNMPEFSASAVSSSESEAMPSTFLEQNTPGNDETLSEQETEVHPIASVAHVDVPVENDEAIASIPQAQDIPYEDDMLSEQETKTEVHAIKQEEPSEASITSPTEVQEPSKVRADMLHSTHEEPETSTENDATFQLPSVHVQQAVEYSDEVTSVTLEPFEADQYDPEYSEEFVASDQYDPEYSEEFVASDQYDPEYSEEFVAESTPDPSETSEELTIQPDPSEFLEPATPIVQEALYPPDLAIEGKTDAGNATRETENTLLPIEEPTIAKVQNRPRPRTRKKSNRASVEKR